MKQKYIKIFIFLHPVYKKVTIFYLAVKQNGLVDVYETDKYPDTENAVGHRGTYVLIFNQSP